MATFTLNPQALSSGTTSVPVGGVVIPANAQSAAVTYTLPLAGERLSTNPRRALDYSIDLSTNAGATWKGYLMGGWRSSSLEQFLKHSTVVAMPGATLTAGFFAAYAGQLVRITTRLSDPMTVGLTVTVL